MTSTFIPLALFGAIESGREESAKFFNDWVNHVKKTVPEDRLLVFDVKQGWEPLCKFLDVPIPDVPFPRMNDTKEMIRRQDTVWWVAHTVVVGFPLLVACGLGLWLSC